MASYIRRDKITKAIRGTHRGPSMPILKDAAALEYVEVTKAEAAEASEKMSRAVAEFRDLTYDGAVILGPAPANVVRIDIEGDTVLKAGDTATIIVEMLGPGTLTLNLGGREIVLSDISRKTELILTVS